MTDQNIRGIEIRHIRAFDAIVKTGSFSEAAKILNTVQPALSRCVKELENVLGAILIDRTTRPIRLSLAGESFHKHAKAIIHRLRISIQDIQEISKGHHGTIKIALSDDINMSLISDLLAQFREDSPGVEIQFLEVDLSTLLTGLRKGDFDLGFCRCPVADDPVIKSICTYQEEFFAVLPKRHPLLKNKAIELDQFLSQPLIFYHPQQLQGSYQQVSKKINLCETQPMIVQYAKSFELMLSLVAAGFGISLIGSSRKEIAHSVNVATRPFATRLTLETYLLHASASSSALRSFIHRTHTLQNNINTTN
ncbi:LysR family transcriptional regulator [Saezia sanguinis]|uniref:LysR family transcriptional regulator n=1 Tax=Saezia sanguinis TaxID=1965230 RepID=UPI00305EB32C